MKNKNLHIEFAYCFLILGLVLFLFGCRTKKSTTDFKQTEIENVSTLITENKEQKSLITENEQKKQTNSETDKSFFEAWMQIKSDEATFEDKAGNKWTFKNPQMNQKSSQTNDIVKTEQSTAEKEKSLQSEEKKQTERKENLQRETKTDLKTTDERKTKIVWLYVIIGAVIVICFVYLVNRYSKKSN